MANSPQYGADPVLTNVANAFVNADVSFIAEKLMPTVFVPKRTFQVPTIDFDLRAPANSLRTGASKAKQVSLNTGFRPGGPLLEHALSDQVYKDEIDQNDAPLQAESLAVENIMQKMMLIDEIDVASKLTDTTIITNNVTLSTATDKWNDANSTPIQDIFDGIKAKVYKPFNTIAMSYEVFFTLAQHPAVLEQYKYTVGGTVTQEQILNLFRPYGITNLYVGTTVQDASVEGLTTDLAPVWGKDVVFAYVTPRPGLKEINGGYKFSLKEGRYTTREEIVNPPMTEVVVHDYYCHEILMPEAFYVIKSAIA